MNVIKQMEYTNKMKESLEKLADGIVNGFRFVILSNGVFPIVRIYCDVRSQYGEEFKVLATDKSFTSTLISKRRPRAEVILSKMGYSMQWNFNKIGDYVGDKEETFVTGRVWNIPDLYAFVVDATEKITFALNGKDLNDIDLKAFENVVNRINRSLKTITGNDEELDVNVDDNKKYHIAYRGFEVARGSARNIYNTLMSISSILFSVVKAKSFDNKNTETKGTKTDINNTEGAVNDISEDSEVSNEDINKDECKEVNDEENVSSDSVDSEVVEESESGESNE